jgi:hypothetical protein
MAQTTINVGSNANDGTGDDLRSAFIAVNANFTELYVASTVSHDLSFSGNKISASSSNANLKLEASGTGVIEFEAIQVRDNHIEASRTNDNLVLGASGTGSIVLGSIKINGTTLSSDDSTAININSSDTLNVTTIASGGAGNVTFSSDISVDSISLNSLQSSDSTAIQINDGVNVSGVLSADTIDTNTISSGDSSAIQIADSVNISGTLTVAGGIVGLSILNNSTQSDGTTTISSSATTEVDNFASVTYRGAKYIVSVSDTTNSRFEIIECLVTHGPSSDSTTEAFLTIYGSTTNHSVPLTTLTADINDGNVRLLATNISSDAHVFKFVRTAVNI